MFSICVQERIFDGEKAPICHLRNPKFSAQKIIYQMREEIQNLVKTLCQLKINAVNSVFDVRQTQHF